jgi:hypothetical protein
MWFFIAIIIHIAEHVKCIGLANDRVQTRRRVSADVDWNDWCTPGMGVILWGESPLYVNRVSVKLQKHKYKPKARAFPRGSVRRKLERKTMSRRTETTYKAQSPGKSAQHDKAPGSGDRVNAAAV